MLISRKKSIADLQEELSSLRTKNGIGRKVPERLKKEIIELLSEYKVSEISKTLKIGDQTLRNWKEKYEKDVPYFIPLAPLKREQSLEELKLKITKIKNGTSWSLEGNLSLLDWQDAINLLGRE